MSDKSKITDRVKTLVEAVRIFGFDSIEADMAYVELRALFKDGSIDGMDAFKIGQATGAIVKMANSARGAAKRMEELSKIIKSFDVAEYSTVSVPSNPESLVQHYMDYAKKKVVESHGLPPKLVEPPREPEPPKTESGRVITFE